MTTFQFFHSFKRINCRSSLLIVGVVIVVLFIYFYSMRVAHLTILPFVPSGDDIAAHIYYTYRVSYDPLAGLPRQFDNRLIVPGPYPNVIHYFMSLVFLFSDDLLTVAKAYGAFSFCFMVIGILLYNFIIWFKLKDKVLTLSTPILMTLLSSRVIQTLGDGSIMELFTIYIIAPLILLLDDKFFFTGFMIGLSSLNYFGIFEVILITSPFILVKFFEKRGIHSFLRFIVGVVVGGNIFLFRLLYHTFYRTLLALFFQHITPATPLAFSPVLRFNQYGSYMFLSNMNSWILYFTLLFTLGNFLLISYLKKRNHVLDSREKASLLFTFSWASLILFTFLPLLEKVAIGVFMQTRILRISSQLSTLPIISFVYLFKRTLRLSFPGMTIGFKVIVTKSGLDKTHKFRFSKDTTIAFIAFLILSSIIIAFSFFTNPSFYAVILSKPGGLIRISSEEYILLQHIKDSILKDERNITIVAPAQVASWTLPLFTDFKKNVSVIFIGPPPDIKNLSSRHVEIYLGLTKNDEVLLKKYNVKYILVMMPKLNQWYDDENKKFATYLWEKDFSGIAELVYNLQHRGIKIWKIR